MHINSDLFQEYSAQLKVLNATLQELQRKKRQYGWLRLGIAVTALLSLWFFWPAFWVLIPYVPPFLWAVHTDLKNRDALLHQERLIEINQQELLYLDHQFHLQDDGAGFADPLHPYAGDLDIFGKASVFQLINRARSEQGKLKLARWLLHPATETEILSRQAAVQSLVQMTDFRQNLQAYGLGASISMASEEAVIGWLCKPNRFRQITVWSVLRVVFPMLSLAWLILYIADITHWNLFLTGLLIFSLIAFQVSRVVHPIYLPLNKVHSELETLTNSLSCMERASFTEESLRSLQKKLELDKLSASRRIKNLKKILDRFDIRMNPLVYVPLNIFLFWDLQQVLALEKWKDENREDIGQWFDALATMETLGSMGTLAFNQPNWVFPKILKGSPELDAQGLGHPLIHPLKSVVNDFSIRGSGEISIITGSNMAGKSTFLRSVGLGMVMASAGAPVYASSFRVTPLRIMSSMRISDNLEESTSTFYAELKKLKAIIDAVNHQEPVFILLDEILRGTNSYDRQAGSLALVRQLIRMKAVGIIATHDLGLAEMEKEFPLHISNYHFDVQVSGTDMFFDYKLKLGVCQSMNASLLMRKIGIELDRDLI